MTHIRINTETVRAAGHRLAAASDQVAELTGVAAHALAGLDASAWDGVSRGRAEALLGDVQPEGTRVAEALGVLARKLTHAAETFEQEDHTAAHDLDGMAWVGWRAGGGTFAAGGGWDGENPGFDDVEGAAGAEYTPIDGLLFAPGRRDDVDIHPNDVVQGGLRDCYLMASLAAVAARNPDAIRRMIRDNGDGTYAVTLYQPRHPAAFWEPEFTPVEVTVTPDFPVANGRVAFAQPGDPSEGGPELWTMLVEKAYAQQNGGYGRIEGGWGDVAMGALTGTPGERLPTGTLDLATLASYNDNGYAMTASSQADYLIGHDGDVVWDIPDVTDTDPLFVDGSVVINHEYYVTGVDVAGGTVTLRNPWGWRHGETVLSFNEFRRAFRRVSVNPVTE